MTVGKLMALLSEFPMDAEVTDIAGYPIAKVCCDGSGSDEPDRMTVWLDTDYTFSFEDIM